MKLLIVGCGYVGAEVVRTVPSDWSISALTRSQDRAEELIQQGVQPIVGNWLEESTLTSLPEVDYVLISVPHRPASGPDHEQLAERTHQLGLTNLRRCLPSGWQKWVYLSTTGIYGECDHEVVNEDTPPSPTRIGPQIAQAGEAWLSDHLDRSQQVILRLAGIYGPGRIPLATKLKAGEPLAVPRQGFLNLVHVVDIARMILVLFERSMKHPRYVFSDGQPVQRAEFYDHLAHLCGVEEPVFVEPDGTDRRVRRATSKRVDPSRLIEETRFVYRFPNYQSGLANVL